MEVSSSTGAGSLGMVDMCFVVVVVGFVMGGLVARASGTLASGSCATAALVRFPGASVGAGFGAGLMRARFGAGSGFDGAKFERASFMTSSSGLESLDIGDETGGLDSSVTTIFLALCTVFPFPTATIFRSPELTDGFVGEALGGVGMLLVTSAGRGG